MDAILGLSNVNVVENALTSLNGASGVVVKIEPRASKRGWRPSRHIMTLLPTLERRLSGARRRVLHSHGSMLEI